MKTYELLGKILGHSFSKPIHEELGAYHYRLLELPDENYVRNYLTKHHFNGCNVTIPYKQTVMPYCNIIEERAKRIGAVNTIVNRNGILYGYNTDYDGFAYMLAQKSISLKNKKVLLLGSGATSKTATAVAQDQGAASITIASRSPNGEGQISYHSAMQKGDFEIIINVSPAGMYPNNGQRLIDLKCFPNLQGVADVVYNPLQTFLLWDAKKMGIPCTNGLPMLVEQAVSAARLFTGISFDENTTKAVLQKMQREMSNIVLVGMPSSGKSKLGKVVARKLGKKFIDLDYVLEKKEKKTIPEIFAKQGEAYFRTIESQVVQEETKKHGLVLATGGGVVTQKENFPFLSQNGIIVFLHRPIQHLQIGGARPLSTSTAAISAMYKKRLPLYREISDIEIHNSAPFMLTVQNILEEINAFFSN